MANIPHPSGLASFEKTATYYDIELLAGNRPAVFTESLPVAESTTIKMYAAVALSSTGNLVNAVKGSPAGVDDDGEAIDAVAAKQAIGIAVSGVTTAAGETDSIAVFRGGCFNLAALVFGDSYVTKADKMNAFAGADSPTQITVKTTLT